jgi:hypothetical protein
VIVSSRDNEMIIEELESGDDISDTGVDSEDEPMNLEASFSNKAQVTTSPRPQCNKSSPNKLQVKGSTTPTDPFTSSRSSSEVELFGGDDTDFLEDFLEETSHHWSSSPCKDWPREK